MSPQQPLHDDGASVISALIDLVPDLTVSAESVLGPISASSSLLRSRLLDDGLILPVSGDDAPTVETMCAIDGARITENLYGADMLVAVATLANAISAQDSLPTVSKAWAQMTPHMPEIDRVVGTAMAILETQVAVEAPHQYRILDGSFLTPVVECIQGLSTASPDIRNRVATLMTEGGMSGALEAILTPDPARPVLALPKSETAKVFTKQFSADYGLDLAVTDRILASQVLEPGEILTPRALTEWTHVTPRTHTDAARACQEAAGELKAAVAGMVRAASDGAAATFYVKPVGARDTVTRCEFVCADPEQVHSLAMKYAQVLLAETRTPHALEPFAQWAVDRQAKAISKGAQAMRATMLARLTADQREAWGWQIAQRYRT